MQSIKLILIMCCFSSLTIHSADEKMPRYPLSEERRQELIETVASSRFHCCDPQAKNAQEELFYADGPWDTQSCSCSNCRIKVATSCQRHGCCCHPLACIAGVGTCVVCMGSVAICSSWAGAKTAAEYLLYSTAGASILGMAWSLLLLKKEQMLNWTSDPANWMDDDDTELALVPTED